MQRTFSYDAVKKQKWFIKKLMPMFIKKNDANIPFNSFGDARVIC